MMLGKAAYDPSKCINCGLCKELVPCPSPGGCVGCGACVLACPYEARRMVKEEVRRPYVKILVNGSEFEVPKGITVKRALEICGLSLGIYPGEGDLQAPCGTGGCYTCVVSVNGRPKRSCLTSIEEGMRVEVRPPEGSLPLRIIHGPQPHTVGGKATPWWIKGGRYIEVAIWAAGCNLRCPQCQNYTTTYDGTTKPSTPKEAAKALTIARKFYGVQRMAISGGEPTLNRRWLVEFFKELRSQNFDPEARLHLDSNGTLLTPEYIDELVQEGGVTDIGVEPKGTRVETFMRITGIEDEALARRYLETSWRAIEHLTERYSGKVFLGVGLPYNSALISIDEVHEFGRRLASIKPDVQLCALDYFPTFKRGDIKRPEVEEMLEVKRVLEDAGLRTVIVQTKFGHFFPSHPGAITTEDSG